MSQLNVLHEVQENTSKTARQGKAEFEAITRDLDEADQRLRGTLEKLKETIVEAGLRPKEEERRSLLDFVDEGGVQGLVGEIRGSIDGATISVQDFERANSEFKSELDNVIQLLGESDQSTEALEGRSPLPDILHEMENHAKRMARELESLVTHYDLCVAAIKHTEGGGDAATKIAKDMPDDVDIEQDVAGPPEPIDEEQREEMIRVIEDDAGDVEGAVLDIRNHLQEMENLHERVDSYSSRLADDHASAVAAFKLLDEIGRKLPNYITQNQVFLLRRDSERIKIDERLEELESLTQFYDDFLRAYDVLLIEVGRRKTVEEKMEKAMQDARAHLEKLYQDEAEEREAFRKEQGDFLPVDIWPGLLAGPLRFELKPLDDEALRVPDISKSVIHQAIKRVHGKR